ncbi:MAG: hypothetical protein IH626_01625 [Rhodospirillales bacterium]|nr:hypothetical protein [Rhodospirillales bacterium]
MDEKDAQDLAVTKVRCEVTRWVSLLTLAMLIRRRVLDGDEISRLIEAKAVDLFSQGRSLVAEGMLVDLAQIKPLILEGIDPAQMLVIDALQRLDAGPELQSAFQEWLQIATPEEISDEVRELLRRWSPPPRDDDRHPGE